MKLIYYVHLTVRAHAHTHPHTHTYTCRMHTLAVDSTGLVYSFGQGSGGQLGIPARTNVSTPSQIDHDFSVLPPRSVGSGLTKRILSPKEVPLCGTSVDPPTDEPMELEEGG